MTLRWRHNGHDSVSNHQPYDCLLNRLFRRRSKKTSKLRVTGLCVGNSPGTGEFPVQMASNAENVSIWWRHYGDTEYSSNIEMPLKWEWIAVPAPREPKLDFLISPLWHLRCMSHKHRFDFMTFSENIHCSTFMSTPNHIKNCVWKHWSLILARVMHLCI